MGLLAETSATDQFTEADAFALAALAKMDELDLEDALLTPQDFLEADVPGVSTDGLRRLLAMLDTHGVAVGVELVKSGAHGAGSLLDGFRRRSGLQPLADLVEHGFARRASALKARGGLADLRRIAVRAKGAEEEVLRAMARPLERIELDPALHDLRILDALRTVEDGTVQLPEELLDTLKRLALEETPARQLGLDAGADPGEIASVAARSVAAWARYGNDARRSPEERRLAEDVREWYELVWDQVGGAAALPAPERPRPTVVQPPPRMTNAPSSPPPRTSSRPVPSPPPGPNRPEPTSTPWGRR
jgi:hypothetical protein